MPEVTERLSTALADRYKIERQLGEGGMATVYLAHDIKHDRKVAIKVLRPELAAVLGAERFVQEIKTTANFQHPHILPLFDSGSAGGRDGGTVFLYYVMPFIDGETLRDKLDREKQLGIDESVRLATDVADALDYAHRKNVIHRDIKPENILLHDGRPMVADFGIALAVSAAAGGRMTETGLSLGTPHYMSPEQATAERDLTARSDVYSLGAVLYEMLSGEPPHMGNTAQQIVMKIVTDDVRPVTELRRSVPPHVAAATGKALEKLPADRFASAADFAAALGDASAVITMPAATDHAEWPLRKALRGLVAAFAIGAALAWFVKPSVAPTGMFDVGLPLDAPMLMHDWSLALDVAPDGDFVVYRAGPETAPYLRYQSLEDTTGFAILGTEDGTAPAISPDGEMVAFLTRQELKTVAVAGGTARTIAEVDLPTSVRWISESGILLNDRDGGLLRWFDVDTDREESEEVDACLFPQPLPTNRVLCGGGSSLYARVFAPDRSQAQFVRIGGAQASDSAAYLRGSDFRLVDDAYLVYMSVDGDVRAVPFDPQSLETGRPATLIQGVRRQSYSGVGQFGLAANGTLVFVSGVNGDVGRLVSWTEGGQPIPVVQESEMFLRYDISPDGRQLAVVVQRPNNEELRRYDLSSGQWEVWHRAGTIKEPRWLSMDRLLVTSADVEGRQWIMIAGSPPATGAPDTLLTGGGFSGWSPFTSTRSGDLIANNWGTQRQLVRISFSGGAPTVDSLLDDAFFATLSPDERWLAYHIGGAILVSPYPSLEKRETIVRDGSEPQWLSATELVYWVQGGVFYRASINPATGGLAGSPTVWYQDSRFSDTPGHSFTLTADGALVYVQEPEQPPAAYLRVIPDWVEQMKRAVDEANR